MKINKWLRTVMISCATALTFGIGLGLQSQSTQVEAATPTYKVVSTTSMAKAPYHKKSSAGAIWNASHTKQVATLKGYPYTTWYATKKASIKKSGGLLSG